MDKIPGNLNQPHSVSKPDTSTTSKQGMLGGKQVTSTDTSEYLDKTANATSDQMLVNRQVTIHNLDMIALLGQEQRWEALSSAINLHGNTLNDLTHILHTLKQQSIDTPPDIQNQICMRFSELTALIKAITLKSKLAPSPIEEHGVLATIAHQPENHDSPIGVISRQEVHGFIKAHGLNSADRKLVVQDMSERMYLMVAERMKSIEDDILATTKDANLKQQIKYSQNERRIEENHRREVSVQS